jgi:hypothetical protein
MLDLKFVRDHLPEVEQAMRNRGSEISLADFLLHDGHASIREPWDGIK